MTNSVFGIGTSSISSSSQRGSLVVGISFSFSEAKEKGALKAPPSLLFYFLVLAKALLALADLALPLPALSLVETLKTLS